MRSSKLPLALWLLYLIALAIPVSGQNNDAANGKVAPPVDGLTTEQAQVADRFKKLEDLLLRSAELESTENPTRSALLQQAAQLGKQSQLADLLARAATRLEKKQFSQAIEDQKTSRESLKRLLELLQSENRGERVREQRDQVRRWIEETDRLLRLQKSLSGRTEGGQEMQQAAGDQIKLADKAAEIASDLGGKKTDDTQPKSADKPADKPADKQGEQNKTDDTPKDDQSKKDSDSESKAADSKDSQSKESQGENKDGKQAKSEDAKTQNAKPEDGQQPGSEASDKKDPAKKDSAKDPTKERDPSEQAPKPAKNSQDSSKSDDASDSESKDSPPNESQPSPSGKKSDPQQSGKEQSGESQPGQPGQPEKQPEPESKDPMERAKQRIEQAQKKMQEAQQALEDAQRKGAVEKQREAEDELRAAIEELEEILRQLREEEIERSLASLETRLRRMLEMQTKVLEETNRLQEITGEQATRQIEIRASNLALEERKILAEGGRAFLLLREEGSSAAFPEAIEQVNADIGNVAERLAKADISKLTTTIEQEIVSSLEEMVAALAQIQKEKQQKKQQQQQGQQQQGEPGDQPLVDKLAELRLIRTLQLRINKRTDALSQMLDNPADIIGQVTEDAILTEVKSLADRQSKIQRVTRDIVVGADQ